MPGQSRDRSLIAENHEGPADEQRCCCQFTFRDEDNQIFDQRYVPVPEGSIRPGEGLTINEAFVDLPGPVRYVDVAWRSAAGSPFTKAGTIDLQGGYDNFTSERKIDEWSDEAAAIASAAAEEAMAEAATDAENSDEWSGE